jgi:hypothetical protein
LAYFSSTDALRQLMQSEGKDIVKISPKENTLRNGVEFCYVALKCKGGTDYSIQAYGKEAIELHEEAMMMMFHMRNKTKMEMRMDVNQSK